MARPKGARDKRKRKRKDTPEIIAANRVARRAYNQDVANWLHGTGSRLLVDLAENSPDERIRLAALREAGEVAEKVQASGQVDFGNLVAEAGQRARDRREARLVKLAALLPQLKAMSLEELWQYAPLEDPDDDSDDIGIGRLVELKRDLLAEIGRLRGEAVPALALPHAANSLPPGGQRALPPGPAALVPEIVAPEPARAKGPDGWPEPTMRLTFFRVEPK